MWNFQTFLQLFHLCLYLYINVRLRFAPNHHTNNRNYVTRCRVLQIACAVASKILVQDMYKCMWRRGNNGYGRCKTQKKHIHLDMLLYCLYIVMLHGAEFYHPLRACSMSAFCWSVRLAGIVTSKTMMRSLGVPSLLVPPFPFRRTFLPGWVPGATFSLYFP